MNSTLFSAPRFPRASAATTPRSRAGDSTPISARRFPRASATTTPRSSAGARARRRRPGWSPCRMRPPRDAKRDERYCILTQSKFIVYSVTFPVIFFLPLSRICSADGRRRLADDDRRFAGLGARAHARGGRRFAGPGARGYRGEDARGISSAQPPARRLGAPIRGEDTQRADAYEGSSR